jgi:hypothetical protein
MSQGKSIESKVYDLIKEHEEAIKYNLGIIASILADNDNELLEPLKIDIKFPNDTILKINARAINGKMELIADGPDIDYIFSNGEKVIVQVSSPDIERVLKNLAYLITHNLSHTMLEFFRGK